MEATSNFVIPDGVRLMITTMILENFKSYAGVQEIGPFHKRFSSIVGPNGSGKSNVIDALLFVFGKRANQLRLNRVSELIHKSSLFPSLEYAKVSVHFQLIKDIESSDDLFDVIEGSQFSVTRIAYLNNQSKYFIESKLSNHTEVGLLLRKYGIDLDNNRFLILQGEVEQIAMMKPKGSNTHDEGLLEYLEDIIGSNRFIKDIEEKSKELEDLNDVRIEKLQRLKIAEKDRDNLSESKTEAETFSNLEKEMKQKMNQLLQHQCFELQRNLSDLNTKLMSFEQETSQYLELLRCDEMKMTEVQSLHDHMTAQYNAIHLELEKATKEFDAFERKEITVQEDIKYQKEQIKKLQSQISKESKKVMEIQKELDAITAQLQNYHQVVKDFTEKKVEEEKRLDEVMQSLNDSTIELRHSLDIAQKELKDSQKVVALLQSEKESLVMASQLLQSRASNAQTQCLVEEKKASTLKIEVEVQQNKLSALQNQANVLLPKRMDQVHANIESLTKQETALSGNLKDAMMKTEEMKAAISAQQSNKNGNEAIKKILQASKKGKPLARVGIIGRLGDLGSIASEYDVAISTACESILDYIVVETTEDGQACMNYLRESNAGRASFIVMNQIVKEWGPRCSRGRSSNIPTHVPRLFDLVQSNDERIRIAFYFAIRDTLLAKDLDEAVGIAYVKDRAKFRVVTLDGNLIETSGAMSGGGRTVRSGAMKLIQSSSHGAVSHNTSSSSEDEVNPNALIEMERNVALIQKELMECRNMRSESERELKELQSNLQVVQLEIEKAKMVYNRLIEQSQECDARLNQLKDGMELNEAETVELERIRCDLLRLDEDILKEMPTLKEKESIVTGLQREIKGVGGPKLSKAQSALDAVTSKLESILNLLSTKQVSETQLQKQLVKVSGSHEKAQDDKSKCDEKLGELEGEWNEMRKNADSLVWAIDLAKAKRLGLEAEVKTIDANYLKIKHEVQVNKSKCAELHEKIDELKSKSSKSTTRLAGLQKELAALREEYIASEMEFYQEMQQIKRDLLRTYQEGSSQLMTLPVLEQEQAPLPLSTYPEDELLQLNEVVLQDELEDLRSQLNAMKESVNVSAWMEYMKKDIGYKIRQCEVETITLVRDEKRNHLDLLRRQRLEEFMAGFRIISLKLKEMYQMITLGGDAELELLDSLDPFAEGIEFSVRPPKKSWKNIKNLSGGEKTLSSLALVFALHHFKPTPLYVMDEIDAALDFKNVSIVANYIKERTKNAQFVIISLRNNMFELADRLVGIYKTYDATKSVTVNPKLFSIQNIEEQENTNPSQSIDLKNIIM